MVSDVKFMLIDVDNVNQAESVTSYFQKHIAHVSYPTFQEKSIKNDLRYVRGLLVMFIDVKNVNQAESDMCVCHIFENPHGTCFISNSREID